VPDRNRHAEAAQPLDGCARFQIRTRHPVALVVEQFGEAAHTDAADSDEVDLLDATVHR